MMFGLPIDVVHNRIDVRSTHRKRTISELPCEPPHFRKRFGDPDGTFSFDAPNDVGQCFILRKAKEHMHVVCDTTNCDGGRFLASERL